MIFFFSSRRRHTRYWRDWSSDVCSSDLELKDKGSDLHAATVVGDTVGDPFKDTSSVAMNPIIKFTTLFGLLAVELAVSLDRALSAILAGLFLAISLVFVWRSFYAMRIRTEHSTPPAAAPPQKATSDVVA